MRVSLDSVNERLRLGYGTKSRTKFPEIAAAVSQWPGGYIGCFSLGVLAGSPIPIAFFCFRHGSTNWGICEGCNKRIVILSEQLTDSPVEFEALRCSGCKNGFVPLLIPPSWDKSGYAQIISPVWKRAVDELKSATRICIIGYSIPETDAFFKYLITLALAGNHQLYKLIVVDYRTPIFNHPRSLQVQGYAEDRVRPRYVSLLDPLFQERRFRYFDNGFAEFLRGCTSRVELDRCEMLMQADFGS